MMMYSKGFKTTVVDTFAIIGGGGEDIVSFISMVLKQKISAFTSCWGRACTPSPPRVCHHKKKEKDATKNAKDCKQISGTLRPSELSAHYYQK